jgi:Ulp1 family protease
MISQKVTVPGNANYHWILFVISVIAMPAYANSLSLANFVGSVVGFLNV